MVLSNGEAHLLTPFQFDHYWPIIKQQLKSVEKVWGLWWTEEAFYEAIMAGWMNCWAVGSPTAIHLVIFTQIVHYPANKMLKIILIFGNKLEEYYDVAEGALEKFAIDNKCAYMEAHGRDGWRRRLENVNYHGMIFTRKVSNLKVQ